MKVVYPAIIEKKEDGRYYATFPDLECCEAQGDDLEDVIDHANEALRTWVEVELQEDDPQLPPVTVDEDIETEGHKIVRNICITVRFLDGYDE